MCIAFMPRLRAGAFFIASIFASILLHFFGLVVPNSVCTCRIEEKENPRKALILRYFGLLPWEIKIMELTRLEPFNKHDIQGSERLLLHFFASNCEKYALIFSVSARSLSARVF